MTVAGKVGEGGTHWEAGRGAKLVRTAAPRPAVVYRYLIQNVRFGDFDIRLLKLVVLFRVVVARAVARPAALIIRPIAIRIGHGASTTQR